MESCNENFYHMTDMIAQIILDYTFQTYTIQGNPKDGGVLPRSLDVLFNSIEGKHYHRMNLKPRFCADVTRLTDDEEHRENNYKNTLLSSLDREVCVNCYILSFSFHGFGCSCHLPVLLCMSSKIARFFIYFLWGLLKGRLVIPTLLHQTPILEV